MFVKIYDQFMRKFVKTGKVTAIAAFALAVVYLAGCSGALNSPPVSPDQGGSGNEVAENISPSPDDPDSSESDESAGSDEGAETDSAAGSDEGSDSDLTTEDHTDPEEPESNTGDDSEQPPEEGEEEPPKSDDTPEPPSPDDKEEDPAPPDDEPNVPPEQELPQNSTFSIHFIDVGQADAALVECDGHYMLIDGGNRADSNLVYSVLKQRNVTVLDIVVGTHAHEDHIGGIPGAFNYATAKLTLCPVKSYDSAAFRNFVKYAEEKGGGITVPAVGDTYQLGSAVITILGVNGGSDTNDTSIVLKIVYGETSFLFTGDAEREAEQAILNSGVDLSATVLKVGHHGSETSTSYLFLRSIAPKYAVISVGEDNTYGHPTEAALSRLRDADVTVYRTDLQGDIVCVSDGKNITFTVARNADADTLNPSGGTSQGTSGEDQSSDGGGAAVFEYIGNLNSKKFHYPDCRHAKSMKEENKFYYTGTREGILELGYTPCGTCNP